MLVFCFVQARIGTGGQVGQDILLSATEYMRAMMGGCCCFVYGGFVASSQDLIEGKQLEVYGFLPMASTAVARNL